MVNESICQGSIPFLLLIGNCFKKEMESLIYGVFPMSPIYVISSFTSFLTRNEFEKVRIGKYWSVKWEVSTGAPFAVCGLWPLSLWTKDLDFESGGILRRIRFGSYPLRPCRRPIHVDFEDFKSVGREEMFMEGPLVGGIGSALRPKV